MSSEVLRRTLAFDEQASERIQNMQELLQSAEKRCGAAIEQAKQAQYALDRAQSEVFERSSKYEDRISCLVSENSLLAESTQRLQLQLAETEKQLLNTRNALSNSNSSGGAGGVSGSALSSSNNEAYEHLISQLTEQLRAMETTAQAEKRQHEGRIRELRSSYAAEVEKLTALREEVARDYVKREDFLRVRREVVTLRRMVFHAKEEEEEEDEPELGGGGKGKGGDGLVELGEGEDKLQDLLVRKVRGLEGELTSLRVTLAESKTAEQSSKDAVSSLRASLDKSAALIDKLEREVEERNEALERYMHRG
ncbi:hypothetical protein EON64_00305, partial [archaeon]